MLNMQDINKEATHLVRQLEDLKNKNLIDVITVLKVLSVKEKPNVALYKRVKEKAERILRSEFF